MGSSQPSTSPSPTPRAPPESAPRNRNWLGAAHDKAAEKRRHYQPCLDALSAARQFEVTFTPLILESFGALHPSVVRTLRYAFESSQWHSPSDYPAWISKALTTLSVALQKGNARMAQRYDVDLILRQVHG